MSDIFQQRAEANLRRAQWFYHVSRVANRGAIKADGLRGTAWPFDEGEQTIIFLLTDPLWMHNVARDMQPRISTYGG